VNGSIPIIVGGDSEAAINRAVRIADGYFPGEGDSEQLAALLSRLRQAAETAGRDPKSIAINAIFGAQMADPKAGIEQMAELGIDRIMVPAFFFAGPGGLDRLSQFGEDIIPLTRS
jgi:alkanesulfonate monooxygenase SsuD/methylene tetrahydromethanopterin reductase-like flavin-dependent oxidoreductase (luciferase family)